MITPGLVHQIGPWRSVPHEFNRVITPSKLVAGRLEAPVLPQIVGNAPELVKSELVKPVLVNPELVKPELVNPELVRPYTPLPVPEVADWVKPEHKCPFLLCVSLYTKPLRFKHDYSFQPAISTARVGVWQNSAGGYFVGLRGTTFRGIGSNDDFSDDFQIGFARAANPDVSLINEGFRVIDALIKGNAKSVMVGGHSLGGYAAIALGATFRLNTCSFNGAAPATRPVLSGPGPGLATHYHIVGDLVSTHMSCLAAQVVRVDKKIGFGFTTPHSTARFYANDPTTRFLDATAEDVALCMWAATLLPWSVAVSLLVGLIVYNNPIPCSARSKSGKSYTANVEASDTLMRLNVEGGVFTLSEPSNETPGETVYAVGPEFAVLQR